MKRRAILTSLMLVLSCAMTVSIMILPSTIADTTVTVTGNFTSSGTLSASVTDSTPDFGNISAGSHSIVSMTLNNDGTTVIDATQDQASEDSGADLSIGTMGSLGADEYSVLVNGTVGSGSWSDAGAGGGTVVANDVAVSGSDTYNLCVNLSSSLTKQYPAAETFSADLTVSEGGT